MKKLIILILLIINHVSFSQSNEIAIVNLNPIKEHDLYFGIINKYKIVIEGLTCSEFNISSNNCLIRRNGCILDIELMDSTVLFIDIHISNNKIKEKVTLSVGLIEEPHLSISGLSGHLTYHKLDSIIAVSNGFEINYEIIHFKANFISNNKLVYFVEHNGNKFSDEDRIQYLNMKSGDIIELNEVLVVGNKKIFQKLDGAKFPIY